MATIIKDAWLWISANDLRTELSQLKEEGRDVSMVQGEFEKLISLGDESLFASENQQKCAALLDSAQTLPQRGDYSFNEPSEYADIRRLCAPEARRTARPPSAAVMRDRIHGAWLGRCIGCMLGKPIEGIHLPHLKRYLTVTGQWPLGDYIAFAPHARKRGLHADDAELVRSHAWYDRAVGHMPMDDDTNYTTAGLLVMEQHGRDFTPVDVAFFWMRNIPVLATCTAERVAYRNFLHLIQPPHSAVFRNPYREWIGAQIRADAFGYACAGNPRRAAKFAWRDASISHIKNGIYGEMFMAACIAAAPMCDNAEAVLRAGMARIPATSRLWRDIATAIDWSRNGLTYDQAMAEIHARWNERSSHDWCHTNSNAVICAVALLYGNGDFSDSICKAVQLCFDTDCNGATVGSIVGMMIGARKIPARWARRINNTLHTSIVDNTVVKIDAMAERTWKLWKKMQA
jgi:ADP-ribosylglycohydrolase